MRSQSIDLFLAFPQDDLEVNFYTELKIGIDAPNGVKRHYVLKLNKSIYFLKQDSSNWFETLKAGLNSIYFEQSQVEPCVF